MSEEQKVGEQEQPEEQPGSGRTTVTEEIKVAAENLVEIVNSLVREGTVRRVTILRNDRILMDIPVAVGAVAGVVLATQMPVISALAGLGLLFSGCTVRIERDEPASDA